jgi:hypothetical protein
VHHMTARPIVPVTWSMRSASLTRFIMTLRCHHPRKRVIQ